MQHNLSSMRRIIVISAVTACTSVSCSKSISGTTDVKDPNTKQHYCRVSGEQVKSLLVGRTAEERADLEAIVKRQTVVVRYGDCEMEVLPNCEAPGAYRYNPLNPKNEVVNINDESALYANIPIGAAKIKADMGSTRQFAIDLTLVGRFESDNDVVHRDSLNEACS